MTKVLLDSNIIIYIAQRPELAPLLPNIIPHYSAISAVEVLGYANITVHELHSLQAILDAMVIVGLDATVINRAIELRQQRPVSLGDSLVAATAQVHGLELWTHNTKDFQWIRDLRLRDPLAEKQ